MNILYYQHQFPAIGGIETVTATLANYFVRQGHRVSIVSYAWQDNADRMVELDRRVVVRHLPSAALRCHANVVYLQRMIDELEIDVLVLQDSYVGIEETLFACRRQPPLVTVEHSSPYWEPHEHVTGWFSQKIWLRHLRHPFSRLRLRMHECSRRQCLYAKSSAYVLLSSRFFGEFKAVARLEDTRKLLAIPNPRTDKGPHLPVEKKNVVLFCGSLNANKGGDLLLSAWRRIAAQTDWTLRIVGDGPDRASLQSEASDLARVEFVGYRSDPMPYFAEAKILAFPSRREGWGLVLVEAMSQGCVPIAFESYSAVRDIVTADETGILVPAFDVEAYAAELLRLIQDNHRRTALANAAGRSIDQFSVDRVGEIWEKLLCKVVSERKNREGEQYEA